MRIGLSPCIYKRLQFLFGKPHLKSAHRFQRTDRAAISESQFCDLALLSEMAVHAVLFNRNLKHLACGRTVDIAAVLKDLCPPVLSGEPGNDARLDCGEVCHIELLTISRDKRRPYQL